jgi:TPR repeat protein
MFSFATIRQMAESGDGVAQLILGWMYQDGIKTGASPGSAIHWYEEASKQGVAHASYALYGMLYAVERERDAAIDWLKKAAEAGLVAAKAELGTYYRIHGDGEDAAELGFRWTKTAADEGYAPAYYELAKYYEEGIHVEADQDTALDCLRTGAQMGDAHCAYRLGKLLLKGEPSSKEQISEGLHWTYEAASKGDVMACLALSMIHGFGQFGVPRNKQLANLFAAWASNVKSLTL